MIANPIPAFPRNLRRQAGQKNIGSYARSMGDHSKVTTRMTAIASTRTVPRLKITGAQVGPSPIKRDRRVQILCSLCTPKSTRPYENTRERTRNFTPVTRIVIATPTTVPEGAGRIALGNSICVKNVI